MRYTSECSIPGISVEMGEGGILVDIENEDRVDTSRMTPRFWGPETRHDWAILRWWFEGERDPRTIFCGRYFIPLWLLACAVAIPTVFVWRRDSKIRRRLESNFCLHCAFDLAGLAVDAVCPECGKAR